MATSSQQLGVGIFLEEESVVLKLSSKLGLGIVSGSFGV